MRLVSHRGTSITWEEKMMPSEILTVEISETDSHSAQPFLPHRQSVSPASPATRATDEPSLSAAGFVILKGLLRWGRVGGRREGACLTRDFSRLLTVKNGRSDKVTPSISHPLRTRRNDGLCSSELAPSHEAFP